MVASYNINYAKYYKDLKQVTQVVSSIVWKTMFKEYKDHYSDYFCCWKDIEWPFKRHLEED